MKFKPLKFVRTIKSGNVFVATTPASEYEIHYDNDKWFYYAYRYSHLKGNIGFSTCAFRDLDSAIFALNEINERDLKAFIKLLEEEVLYIGRNEDSVFVEGFLTEYWMTSKDWEFTVFGDSYFVTEDIQIDGIKSLDECEKVMVDHYNEIKRKILSDIQNLLEEE
jgi:hypothetical protein